MTTEGTDGVDGDNPPCWPATLCYRDTEKECVTEPGHPCEFSK